MNLETILTIFDYYRWSNRRVWGCIETLTDAQFVAPHNYSIGSIHEQVFHLMLSDSMVLAMLKSGKPTIPSDPTFLNINNYPTRIAIRTKWDELERDLLTYIQNLCDADLQRPMPMPDLDGTMKSCPLWEVFFGVVNHGVNHNAQILALLHQLNAPTVEQGFYFYRLEHQ